MEECERLGKCPFFNNYKDDEQLWTMIKGFALIYCKGTKKDSCIRKKISISLGPEFVPVNMMPNGKPIPGTGKEDWDKKIMPLLDISL